MRVTVERSETDLDLQVWYFNVNVPSFGSCEIFVSLDSYISSERPTKRHKLKPTGSYGKTFSRSSTIKLEDVPIPEDVKAEVLNKVKESITFKL